MRRTVARGGMHGAPREFVPNPKPIWSVAFQAAAVMVLVMFVGPWQGLPMPFAIPTAVGGAALVLGNFVVLRHFRGHDAITLTQEGILVANRRRQWQLRWEEIGRVYRFKGQLIFETPEPVCKRFTVLLDGHDDHKTELCAAVVGRARSMNLRWAEHIADLLG